MNLLILYESCTGNTELGVEVIRRTLEKDGHRCTMQRFRDSEPGDLEGYDLYCFATPIQSFAPLTTVYRFIKSMPKLQGRPAFIFTTGGGWPGVAHRMMAGLIRRKGMAVLGARMLACPDNWPIGRKFDRYIYDRFTFPRKKSMKKTQAFARDMIGKAYHYRDGIKVKQAPHFLWPTPTMPLGFFAVRGMLARGYGKRTVDAEACNGCGVCVETCPVGAVRLCGLPAFDDTCIGCWACFNKCPTHAILSSACEPQHYFGGIADREKQLKKVGL
jgi:NAD-dependent dihydropyrimidine dehydrogenase PreA subunit/flavodoxin